MPEQRIRTTTRGSKRKAELLAASARLFEQQGYHNVSMDDIAATAGITGPALYRHFSSKHEVLVQAIDEQVTSIERLAQQVLSDDCDGEARFEAFLAGLASLVVDVHQVLLWKREQAHLAAGEQARLRLRLRAVASQVARIIRGSRPGLSDADALLLSWVLQSIYSSTDQYRRGMDRSDLERLVRQMARAAMSVDLASAPFVDARARSRYVYTPTGRRERLLEAATELFYKRGYRAVSVEDIAEASQTAIATVYQLVSNKAHLLDAILTRGSEGIKYLTVHRLAQPADGESPLDTIVNTYIEIACGPHVRLLKILTADLVYLDEAAQAELRRGVREYVEEWQHALSELRPDLPEPHARARVHTAMALIGETMQIAGVRRSPNLQGEMRLLVSAILRE